MGTLLDTEFMRFMGETYMILFTISLQRGAQEVLRKTMWGLGGMTKAIIISELNVSKQN